MNCSLFIALLILILYNHLCLQEPSVTILSNVITEALKVILGTELCIHYLSYYSHFSFSTTSVLFIVSLYVKLLLLYFLN